MKKLIFTFTFIICLMHAKAQCDILNQTEVERFLNDSVKMLNNIDYNIFRVYHYKDKLGDSYVVLTERSYDISPKNDTVYDKIRAINFTKKSNFLEKKWELYDFILPDSIENNYDEDISIWFWTRYFDFQDIDKDGLVDPIIVYGTGGGYNRYEYSNIKIFVLYRGKKIAIRHQNASLDPDRYTNVDIRFYYLPLSIQERVKDIMKKLEENNHANFPHNWLNAMKKKKTYFDER